MDHSTTPSSKAFDIVVWGCTGFTGRLVLRYLTSTAVATKNNEGLRLAVGGRSKAKIEKVLSEEDAKGLPIIVADSADEASLTALVEQTGVVISLVGPYNKYGSLLVKVCAEKGVHYVDLTGETAWQAKMIKEHEPTAVKNGALIVHACGFDSVPSDLNCFLAVKQLKASIGVGAGAVGEVKGAMKYDGGVSGGTFTTLLDMVDNKNDPQTRKAVMNPYSLSSVPPNKGASTSNLGLTFSSTYKNQTTWGSFFPMSVVNAAVVWRSWSLSSSNGDDDAYGPEFSYAEFVKQSGYFSALATSLLTFASIACLVFIPPVQWAAKKWGPKPGDGPSLEVQTKGWFKVTTTATSVDKKHEAQVVMSGKGDPGYSATSKMIAECALCIAKDWDKLPPLARKGGMLTPATAFGNVLVDRLKATGMFTFEVK